MALCTQNLLAGSSQVELKERGCILCRDVVVPSHPSYVDSLERSVQFLTISDSMLHESFIYSVMDGQIRLCWSHKRLEITSSSADVMWTNMVQKRTRTQYWEAVYWRFIYLMTSLCINRVRRELVALVFHPKCMTDCFGEMGLCSLQYLQILL